MSVRLERDWKPCGPTAFIVKSGHETKLPTKKYLQYSRFSYKCTDFIASKINLSIIKPLAGGRMKLHNIMTMLTSV